MSVFDYQSLSHLKKLIDDDGKDYNELNCIGESLLYVASEKGDVDVVRYLLEEKEFDINLGKRSTEFTPLHIAAEKGHLELVKLLVEKNADFEVPVFDWCGRKPIHCASQYGHNLVVAFFIDEKVCGVDSRARDGRTPLHIAAMFGKLETVQVLVERGADITARDGSDNTALHWAARFGWRTNIVKYLINSMKKRKNRTDVDSKDYEGKTPLHITVERGRMETVKLLVETIAADIAATDNAGNTVLHIAAKGGRPDMIEYLMEMNKYVEKKNQIGDTIETDIEENRPTVNVDSKNNIGKTALHVAIEWGHIETVKLLVETFEADIKATDKEGNTVLHFAAKRERTDMIEYLMEKIKYVEKKNQIDDTIETDIEENRHTVNVDSKNNIGKTPLHIAVECGHIETVKLLVETFAADIKATDKEGNTVLHFAAKRERTDMIEYLMEMNKYVEKKNEIDVNSKNSYGETPLHVAVEGEHMEIVKLLVETFAADIKATDKEGNTVLHFAAKGGRYYMIEYLMEKIKYVEKKNQIDDTIETDIEENRPTVDVDSKNYKGKTALHVAVECGHMETVKLLIQIGGADIAATDNEGNTVLHFTATHNRTNMIEYLIEKNKYVEKKNQIDVNSKNKYGTSPLHVAVASGMGLNFVKMLIDKFGADIYGKNNYGKNVLHYAAEAGENALGYLNNFKKLDVNSYDNNGTTALHYAAWSGIFKLSIFQTQIITLLLKRRAKINASDKMKRTVVHYYAIDYPDISRPALTDIELPPRDISTFEYSHPCRFKNLDILKLLVKEGADLMAIDEYGKTVMHYAARFGHTHVIEFLIDEKKMPVDMTDLNGVTPLHLAKQFGHEKAAELLVKKGARVVAEDTNGKTVTDYDAAKRGKSDVFANCFGKINSTGKNGKEGSAGTSLLSVADSQKSSELTNVTAATKVDEIIEDLTLQIDDIKIAAKDQDKNKGSCSFQEALEPELTEHAKLSSQKDAEREAIMKFTIPEFNFAAKDGRSDLVDEKKMDPKIQSCNVYTQLQLAVKYENLETAKRLLENRSDVSEIRNVAGKTLLHFAAEGGKIDTIKFLTDELKMKVDIRDDDGRTPLHYAVWLGQCVETVNLLLENGAKIHARDKIDRTVLHYYAADPWYFSFSDNKLPLRDISTIPSYSELKIIKNLEILKLLIAKNADLMAKDMYGKTVMHYSALRGHTNVMKILIDEIEKPVDIVDANGSTPLHLAVQFEKEEVAKLLVENGADIMLKDNYGKTVLDYAADREVRVTLKDLTHKEKSAK